MYLLKWDDLKKKIDDNDAKNSSNPSYIKNGYLVDYIYVRNYLFSATYTYSLLKNGYNIDDD
jgi:hypothetical protein